MNADHTLDPLIGRLIWVGVRGDTPGDPTLEAELDLCLRAHAGGVILFDVDVPQRNILKDQGFDEAQARLNAPRNVRSPEQLRQLTEHIRQRLGPRTVISTDQEGGFVCRLNPARGFPAAPSPADYAALDDNARADAAHNIAQPLARAGVDLNLAPCVDVAINPDGPGHTALGRSFGDDPQRVAGHAKEQIDALHRHGVNATLKHFPGHGSATGDSHFGLVDITDTFQEHAELLPYRQLTEHADAVMVSHLVHRRYDESLPCSLSPAVINGLLRQQLGHRKLVLTDALDMHAVADRFGPENAAALALAAGADVALEANNLTVTRPCPAPRILDAVRKAVRERRITHEHIEHANQRLDNFWIALDARRNNAAAQQEHPT